MLYTTDGTDFAHHVHPNLKKRIRIFLIVAAIMLGIVVSNIINHQLTIKLTLIAIVIGAVVGLISNRIFNISWDTDAELAIGRIDTVGWIVLVLYILFEVARSYFFQAVLHIPASATAVTFAFVGSALVFRVVGWRRNIIRVLREEDKV